MAKLKKIKMPSWVNRPYHDNMMNLWFCPDCDFSHEEKHEVKKHWVETHQLISKKGVIL